MYSPCSPFFLEEINIFETEHRPIINYIIVPVFRTDMSISWVIFFFNNIYSLLLL